MAPWLAAIAIGVGVGVVGTSPQVLGLFSDPMGPLRHTVGLERLGPGRFSGEIQRARRDSVPDLDERLGDAERNGSVTGVVNLLRDLPDGLRALEDRARQEPDEVASWSDLAAGYLTRAVTPGAADDPLDLIAALRAALKAIEIDPEDPQARFNYAEVLTRCGLRHEALKGWNQYLAIDPTSDWAALALARRKELGAPTHNQLWVGRDRPALLAALAAGDRSAVAAVADKYRARSRELVLFELLPAWAVAVLGGESATSQMHQGEIELLAQILAELTGDHLLSDAAHDLNTTSNRRQALAAVLARWRRDGELDGLDRVASRLKELDSPLSVWASYWAERVRYNADRAATRENLADLENWIADRPYPVIRASILGLRGLLEAIEDRPEGALAHYQHARRLAADSEGIVGELPYLLFEASAAQRLGRLREAWHARLQGAALSAQIGDRYRRHGPLLTASEALIDAEDWSVAAPFVNELQANARRAEQVEIRAESLLAAGRLAAAQSRWDTAEEFFGEALRDAKANGHSLKARLEAMAGLARGSALLATAPDQASVHLEDALNYFRQENYLFYRAETLTLLGTAEARRGRPQSAAADFRLAIEALEYRRQQQGAPASQVFTLEQTQPIFDALMLLQLDAFGSPAEAFSTADRSKALRLTDTLGLAVPGAKSWVELREQLPPHVVLIEYAVLPDRLAIWVASRTRQHFTSVPVTGGILGKALEGLRRAVHQNEGVETARAELSRWLLKPIANEIEAGDRLVVIPDGDLGDVPWALLQSTNSSRPLVLDHEISLAPNANIALTLLALPWVRPETALVVSDPEFDDSASAQRLPDAAMEGQEVAQMYSGSAGLRLLTGPQATAAAFLTDGPEAEVIHFAGHSVGVAHSPADSALVLAPSDSEAATTLPAWRIAEVRWEKTRLVVLSSCQGVQSGVVGREVLAGLSTAFLAGGVPTLVASPAKVPEAPTRAFMKHFHRALRSGQRPAQALRSAQIEMILSPNDSWNQPKHWATWVVIGAP